MSATSCWPARLPCPRCVLPLVAVVEAGLGQCIARMIGARLVNERTGAARTPVFGCVTTGEIWQFLQLDGAVAALDRRRYYLDDVAGILGAFQAIVERAEAVAPVPVN